MLDQLLLNTRIHLRFFARNRLILALGAIALAGAGLSLIPSLLFRSTVGRFELLRMIVSVLSWLALVVIAGLGLFAVSGHLRGRSLKMVLTKPCSPEIWLGSVFLAAGIVAAGIYAALLLLTAALSFFWGVPFQSGFAFIIIDGFLRALIWMSWLTALGTAFHPVLAALIALFFQEGTLYWLKFMIASTTQSRASSGLLAILGNVVDAIYFSLPMVEPLSQKTEPIYSSLRMATGDWDLLLPIAGYALLILAFFYCVSDYLIRRKALI